MAFTNRVTLRALEEVLDVGAVLADLRGALAAATADGHVSRHEQAQLRDLLRRLHAEHREAVQHSERADYHMEVITGWTREGGPNEKTERRAAHHGYRERLCVEINAQPQLDTRETA